MPKKLNLYIKFTQKLIFHEFIQKLGTNILLETRNVHTYTLEDGVIKPKVTTHSRSKCNRIRQPQLI